MAVYWVHEYPMAPLLSIKGLHVSIGEKEIVKGVDLSVPRGEIHAIMGPNGAGKSTLVQALMGHPSFSVTSGSALMEGKNLLKLDVSQRARAGLFLGFQYPRELSGVTLRSFLFAAFNACHPEKKKISPIKFQQFLEEKMRGLSMDPSFADRSLNQGFSGGEKKKAEVLQLVVLEPKIALLDETDSGLDIDALKVVAEGVNEMRSQDFSAVVVTHYARLLDFLTPDRVHVMIDGKIVESGGMELAHRLEKEGYAKYGVREDQINLDVA